MATAVVCDDDRVLRSAVTAICEDLGLQVVAETDMGGAALELVHRFDVDILVLDQSLPDMTGESVLQALGEELDPPLVVVFSAFAEDAAHLLSEGAREVVDKPDFERLEKVLASVLIAVDDAAARSQNERRTSVRRVRSGPAAQPAASGAASADDLLAVAPHTEAGDTVLVVAEVEDGSTSSAALLDLLRSTVRIQDLVHDATGTDGYVLVLRGGDEHAAEAVWRRLQEEAGASSEVGRLRGAWRRIDALGLMAAVAGAESALIRSLDGEQGLQPA